MENALSDSLKTLYVVFAFCVALCLGALKSLLVGPIAGLIVIIGNIEVVLVLFPAHVVWTVYALVKTKCFDLPLKVAFLFALPALCGIWLGLSIAGSVLIGVGYGFFSPWVSAFEAFRQGDEIKKFFHCTVDGTWGTIKGSCTVVRDFADICYHSYPLYLKELCESPISNEHQLSCRFINVPGFIFVGLLGLIVEIPLYTGIAIVKSPYMLFKGWQRLIHDLISREGPFLETACIPIAGLTILMWPLIVIGSIVLAIFSSFFIGLYASFITYEERSFRRGVAYIVAMVAEFDEYTNDWLYLREGSILPKPRYRKKNTAELSVGGSGSAQSKFSPVLTESPIMLVPTLATSRSVKEAIHDVKMVQVWGSMMRSCEMRGKELLDAGVIKSSDLYDWLKARNENDAAIVGVGLPCYSLLQSLLHSIRARSDGLLLLDDIEITHLNRPRDRLLDWFFQPLMVLKEQLRVIQLGEDEIKFLEKVVLFANHAQRMAAWDGGSSVPQDAVRAAQIEGLIRRMMGMTRSISKLPTYRRKYKQIVKDLIIYSVSKEATTKPTSHTAPRNRSIFRSMSTRSVVSV